MNNPILQSEGFERAAYAFRDAVAEFTRSVGHLAEEMQNFNVAVTRLEQLKLAEEEEPIHESERT